VLPLMVPAHAVEEDAAMARVDCAAVDAIGRGRAEGGGGHEGRRLPVIAEEAEHRGRAVELAESAPEAGVGDEAAPRLADEGGADEARGLLRREADEDLFHKLLHQRRRAATAAPWLGRHKGLLQPPAQGRHFFFSNLIRFEDLQGKLLLSVARRSTVL